MAAVALAAVALGCSGSNGGDREAFCATATQLGDESLLSPEVIREQLDRLGVVYEELADTAPGPVSDDVDRLNEAVQKLREGDISFVADEEQTRALAEAFESVSDYVREECP